MSGPMFSPLQKKRKKEDRINVDDEIKAEKLRKLQHETLKLEQETRKLHLENRLLELQIKEKENCYFNLDGEVVECYQ